MKLLIKSEPDYQINIFHISWYTLNKQGIMVQFQAWGKNIFLFSKVCRLDLGAHLDILVNGYQGLFPQK
jgi:hypothetical protein